MFVKLIEWLSADDRYKRFCVLTSLFLLTVIILLHVGFSIAYAGTNFGQSPTTNDIVIAKKNSNGDIIVLDRSGKVYKFDYFKWYTIDSNTSKGCIKAYYDNNLGKIIYMYMTGYNNGRIAVFNLDTLSWEADFGEYYDRFSSDCFYRRGVYYRISHTGDEDSSGKPQLFKWNETSWELVSSGADNSLSSPTETIAYYDNSSDSVYVLYEHDSPSGDDAYLFKYEFSTNTWTKGSARPSVWGLSSESYRTVIYNNGGLYFETYISNGSYAIKYVNMSSYSNVVSGTYVTLASNSNNILKYSIAGVFEGYNLNFNVYTVEYDKYGNLFIAGSGGRCAVKDLGGVIQTNTDFYTDYVINLDIKPDIKNAVSAAIQARDAANTASTNALNAYNAANTAKNEAINAKNEAINAKNEAINAKNAANNAYNAANMAANQTIYNGQSAAYWANQAYQYAQQAAQNSVPVISKVQGLNGATCTTGTSFTVCISASGSGLNYRIVCGSFDSGWVTNNVITINNSIVSGANTAIVQVKNSAGNIAQQNFVFFKV